MSEAVVIEITHRQIPHMLGDLHAFSCAGVISAFGLEHHASGFDQAGTDYGKKHDSKCKKNILCRHTAAKQCAHHTGYGRDLESFEDCLQYSQKNGLMKSAAVFLPAEGKKAADDLNHCPSPPYARSTSFHTGHDGQAVPRGSLAHGSCRPSPHRSCPHPQ